MNPADALLALVETARGPRPASLENREAEEVLAVALALIVELSVSNDRIDRLERLLAEMRGESVEALRDIAYEGAAAAERQTSTDALMLRALRIFFDPRTPADRRDPSVGGPDG